MKPSCLDHQDRTSTVLSLTRWGLPFFGTAKSKRPSSACRSDQRSGSWRCDGTQGATYSSWFHRDRGQKTSAQLDSWDSRAIARDPCPKTVIASVTRTQEPQCLSGRCCVTCLASMDVGMPWLFRAISALSPRSTACPAQVQRPTANADRLLKRRDGGALIISCAQARTEC